MYLDKIKKGWIELDSEIIKKGKCVYCGACGAFCANIKFDFEKEVPIEDGSCQDVNTSQKKNSLNSSLPTNKRKFP